MSIQDPARPSRIVPAPVGARSGVRIVLAIAFAATWIAGPAFAAGEAPKAAPSHLSAAARAATLHGLDSLLAAGRYGAAVAPALELAASLDSRTAPDSSEAIVLDRVVRALLAGGRGADSTTVALAARAVHAHQRLHGAESLPTAAASTAWARCLAARREDAAASAAFERGLAIEIARSAPDSLRVAETLEWLGRARLERGDPAGASGPIVRSLAIRERALGTGHRDVARSLDAFALDLRDLGDYPKARAAAESSLAIRQKLLPDNHPEIAESLDDLGTILDAGVRWGGIHVMRGVLKVIRSWVEPKHSTLGWDMFNSATESLRQPGDFNRAASCFVRAVKIRFEFLGEFHPETATSLLHLGRHRQDLGDTYRAMTDLRRVLAIRERVFEPTHPDVAEALVAVGELFVDNRDPVAARPYFDRALTIQQHALPPEDPVIASSLLGMASVLEALGDTREAVDHARRALAIREKGLDPENPLVAEALLSVAELEHETGDDASAEPQFKRALALFEQIYDKQHPRVADACEAWAVAFRDRGDRKGARELLERALKIRESAFGDKHPDVAHTLNELVWVDDKNPDKIPERLNRAAEIFEASYAPGHPARVQLFRDEALTDWWWGNGDLAVATHALRADAERRRLLETALSSLPERQALALAARTPRSIDIALSTGLGVTLAPVLESLIASRGLVLDELGARRLERLGSDSASAQLEANFQEASARLASLMVRGNGPQSTENYAQLVTEAERDREQAERALGDRANALGDRERSHRIGLKEVVAALPTGAAIVSFVRYQQYRHIPSKEEIDADMAEGISEQEAKTYHAFHPYPPQTRPPFTRGENQVVPSYLAIITTHEIPQPAPKGMWAKLKQKAKESMTSEGIGPGAAFHSRETRIQRVVRLGAAAGIDSLVASWVDAAAHGPQHMTPKRADETMLGAGQALRQRIWDPVVKNLGNCDRVFIVPDGSLQLVNFAALPATDGSYLVEHAPMLHLLSAERDLALSAGASTVSGKLLAFGGPSFDDVCAAETLTTQSDDDSLLNRGAPVCSDFGKLRFAPLPATTEEVAEIGRLWRAPGDSSASEVVALVGPQACETEFKRLAHGSSVLHLATHGFFVSPQCAQSAIEAASEQSSPQSQTLRTASAVANPLALCGLALAGANRRADAPPGTDDGILSAQEIAALDLRGTQWSVLSACETGVGEVVSGEGVLGLRRSFQMAGSRTLIMSLWSVEDDPTRQWMNALYEARFVKKMSTMEAVRAASLAQLAQRREHGLSTHPFYWAAFVAAGDWR